MKKRGFRLLISIIAIGAIICGTINGAAAVSTIYARLPGGGDSAGAIHVSPNGNDSSATGASNAPYKSINSALETAEPGDTIILADGVYREGINVRIRTPNITIKSADGEWAVIDLTVFDSDHDEDSGVYFDVDSSGGRLQNVEVIGGFYAVCMETKWDWGDPADRGGASDIIIEGCKLHDSRYDVVKVKPNCDNITIRNNEIYNSGQAFAGNEKNGEDNAEGIDIVNGDNVTIQNNYIHDICSNAIYAKGGAIDALIENNRIERAYGGGILVGFDTSPEFFDTAVNPHYYENIRGVVRNNLIIDTGWEGIGIYAASGARIYNNTLVNVANGGQYHSAIYFGLSYQDWEPYAGRPASVDPGIHHNIVSLPSDNVLPIIEIRYANELGGLSALEGNPDMNNNCYYIAGKSASFTDLRPNRQFESGGLSEWQAYIGGDSGSIEADPALDADYMPGNPQCAGMGITSPLLVDGGFMTAPGATTTGAADMSNFRKVNSYAPGMFADVDESEWYGFERQKVIANVYEYGLMQGSGADTFNPSGNMTLAEAIAVAARVRSIYSGASGVFAQSGAWYQVYVSYAIDNGIITAGDFSSYTRAATRAEIAYIFSNALPDNEYAGLNTVNSLPDVNNDTSYRDAIIILYSAGVLSGSDAQGAFNPDGNITRAESAAIISRVILPETRISGNTYG